MLKALLLIWGRQFFQPLRAAEPLATPLHGMEWKTFSMEWKKFCSTEYGKIVFHSTACPAGWFVEKLFKYKKTIIDTALSVKNIIEIPPRKTRPKKDLERPRGGTEGGGKIALTYRNCLRSWSAPFPRHPDYVF